MVIQCNYKYEYKLLVSDDLPKGSNIMATKMSRFNVSVPSDELESANKVLKTIGLSTQTAIRLFLNQVRIQKRIPFDLTARQEGANGNKPDDIVL